MLKVKSDKIKLDYTSITVEITLRSSLATVSLTQLFHNPSPSPAELTYSISQPYSSVITSLKAIFSDETKIELKVMEKNQAKEKFQDSLSQGHQPIMAQSKESLLNLYIGYLPAGQSIKIITNFAFPLTSKENFWKFEMPEGIVLQPSIEYKVHLSILSDVPIQQYKSNWDFDYTTNHNSLSGLYCSSTKPFNPDPLEFSYKTTENIEPKLIIQSNGHSYAAMLSFIPYYNDSETPDDYESTGEFIFIIDRSGSMSGERIKLAKNAATLFLKSLSKNCTFNIISFGSAFKFLYPDPVIANSFNVSEAISEISNFSADMGGTEIYKPLQEIYQKNIEIVTKRFIFLLTDGDVTSPQQVVDLIGRNQDKGKIFSFGIEDANEFLIRETAIKGNGESYYIKQAVDIGKNVIKALTVCVSPFVENVKVNLDWDFAPKLDSIKWINYGSRFCVFALGNSMPDGSCFLTCFDSFRHRELRFEIVSREIMDGDELFKLWAKHRIEDDPINCLELSLQYQVISPKTCYFASKTNTSGLYEEILPGMISSNRINPSSSSSSSSSGSPRNLKSSQRKNVIRACIMRASSSEEDCASDSDSDYPLDWKNKIKSLNPKSLLDREERSSDSSDSMKKCSKVSIKCARKSSNSCSSGESDDEIQQVRCLEESPTPLQHKLLDAVVNEKEVECKRVNCLDQPLKVTKKKENVTFLDIVICQDSEGYWDWKAILDLVELKEPAVEYGKLFDDLRVAGTCLALAYLAKFFSGNKEEWVLVENKGLRWVKRAYQDYAAGIERFKELL